MGERKGSGRLWYVLGPVLLYWAIRGVTMALVEVFLVAEKLLENSLYTMNLTAVFQYIQEHIVQVSNLLVRYTVECTTAGALTGLLFGLLLYWKDRMRVGGSEDLYPESFWAPGGTSPAAYLPLMGLGIFLSVALNNLVNLLGIPLQNDGFQTTSALVYQAPLWMQIAGLGILVPLSEEVLFRGLLYRRLRDFAGVGASLLLSSLGFAFIHGNLVQGVYAFLLGLALGYVYERYRCLWAPLLLHALANITALVVTALNGFSWMFANLGRLALVTLGSVFLSAFGLVFLGRLTGGKSGQNPL